VAAPAAGLAGGTPTGKVAPPRGSAIDPLRGSYPPGTLPIPAPAASSAGRIWLWLLVLLVAAAGVAMAIALTGP
jgi:hypothetical protein